MAIDTSSGILLKLRFKPGTLVEYKVSTRITQETRKQGEVLGQQSYHWKSKQTQRVLAEEPDGSGHMVTISEPVGDPDTWRISGVPIARSVVYTHLAPDGSIKETSGPDAGAALSLPVDPVKVGDEWTGLSRLSLPGLPAPLEALTHYRLVGTEEVAGLSCVKIELDADQASAPLPVEAPGIEASISVKSQGSLFFAPEQGLLVGQQIRTVTVPALADATYETVTELTQELGRLEGF